MTGEMLKKILKAVAGIILTVISVMVEMIKVVLKKKDEC